MAKIGYIRVSSIGQETARQDQLMQEIGVDKIFSEKLSGKSANRPKLKNMLSYVREGDTLYVESISRLSRSKYPCARLPEFLKQHTQPW